MSADMIPARKVSDCYKESNRQLRAKVHPLLSKGSNVFHSILSKVKLIPLKGCLSLKKTKEFAGTEKSS
jgi:hypothetical protein